MAFSSELRVSSALQVLISEGHDYLVNVTLGRIVFQPLQPYWEQSGGLGGGRVGCGNGDSLVQTRTWVRPTIKLLLAVVVGRFYWLMLFKPLATGVNTLVFQWWRPAFLQSFNSLCTGYIGFKGFGAGVFWHQWEGDSPVSFPLVSSSTFCNSRHHNGKGSCADRPRNQTGSRRSAARNGAGEQRLSFTN